LTICVCSRSKIHWISAAWSSSGTRPAGTSRCGRRR
jgi:hypothetical protein